MRNIAIVILVLFAVNSADAGIFSRWMVNRYARRHPCQPCHSRRVEKTKAVHLVKTPEGVSKDKTVTVEVNPYY